MPPPGSDDVPGRPKSNVAVRSASRDSSESRGGGPGGSSVTEWLANALQAERAAAQQDLESRHRQLVAEFESRFRNSLANGGPGAISDAISSRSRPPKPEPLDPVVPEQHGQHHKHRPGRLKQDEEDPISPSESPSKGTTKMKIGSYGSQKPEAASGLPWLVHSTRFEMVFGFLIMLNTLVMCMEVQYEGVESDYIVSCTSGSICDKKNASESWPMGSIFFEVSEWFFGVAFTIELLLKLAGLRISFVRCGWNLFDFVIVFLWLVDKLSSAMGANMIAINPMLLRFVRLARLLRLLKALKWIQMFDSLQVLIASIKGSVSVLFWSSLLMFAIMMVCSMIFNHFLRSYIRDEEEPIAVRSDVYKYFGSFSRSMVTMLELTLGNWVPVCRLLMNNITEWYALIIIVYKILVGFGVVKVITGVFLHETFKVASTDDEIMIMQKQREHESHRAKMQRLFAAADDGGDGTLTLDEFRDVLADENVKTWLGAMGISTDDVQTLFALLAKSTEDEPDETEPRISVNEFLAGTSRLKGSAKSLDMWKVLTETEHIRAELGRLELAILGQSYVSTAPAFIDGRMETHGVDVEGQAQRDRTERVTALTNSASRLGHTGSS